VAGFRIFKILRLTALFFLSFPLRAAYFNYLYIEASEGNSSGGHVAIQLDDDIYHYQHVDNGLIRLFRQNKTEFHFLYRYLQNRPLHLSRIEVSEETLQSLKDQFKQQLLTQERQFKGLDALRQDRVFLRYLLRKLTHGDAGEHGEASVLRLKGAGLFYAEQEHRPTHSVSESFRQQIRSIERLREKVERRYGINFLQRRRQQAESQIEALSPTRWAALNSDWAGEDFSGPLYSFTEKCADALSGFFAIKVFIEAMPLQPGALLQMHQPLFKITEIEKRELQTLRQNLEIRLIKAFDSNRPDWGYAVLINLARIIAIDVSLQSGYWAFIDDFADNSEKISPDQYLKHYSDLRILIRDARKNLNKLRESVTAGQPLTEADYSQIEMAANRYSELLKSEQHQDFRYNGEKALPSKSLSFPDEPLPSPTKAQLTAALAELEEGESRLVKKLNQDYRYDLFTRNCVTELFRTIESALSAPYSSTINAGNRETLTIKASEKRLGGYVEIAYNFIPFISYQAVLRHYRVAQSYDLDSYRQSELAKLKTRQNPLLTELRESNILTSGLYRYNPDDAWFVFFTDGNVWLRPLFGLFNTTAGVGQSMVGLFSWPLDSGNNLKAGATGILMSLPEMLFFNMRKGSYKYLSFNPLINAGLPPP
jgi:hypothetical protein